MNQTMGADQADIFAFLQDPRTHGLRESVTRIDTHGAAVFLAGPDVYKVKRAVHFPFMDFSTLEKRHTACEAEIVVNRTNAPGLYLGVVPITLDDAGFRLDGKGPVVEWAVHLRRFDEGATLDRLADKAPLGSDLTDRLARAVLAAHQAAPRRDGDTATRVLRRLLTETVDELGQASDAFPREAVSAFGSELIGAFDRAEPLLLQRAAQGQVRRCHGDLHLGNLVLIDGAPVLFDAIEFDDAIATSDILYDLAFLIMDLCERGRRADANRLLNRYVSLSADEALQIEGLAALPLFLSLRASIRAKVIAARLRQSPKQPSSLHDEALAYFRAAASFLAPIAPFLIGIGGLSGTGKTSLAKELAPEIGAAPGALHLRSDVERKRLFAVAETARLPLESYRPEISAKVYARLNELAIVGLEAGRVVILDATFQQQSERDAIAEVAGKAHVPFAGIWLDGPVELLMRRVADRVGDASDATPAIVMDQAREQVGVITWDRIDASLTLTALKRAALALMPCPYLPSTPPNTSDPRKEPAMKKLF